MGTGAERAPTGWKLDGLDGPDAAGGAVHGYGTVNGLPFYFGAAGRRWRFAVSATPDQDPMLVEYGPPGASHAAPDDAAAYRRGAYFREGDWESAPGSGGADASPARAAAERIILSCAQELAAGGAPEPVG